MVNFTDITRRENRFVFIAPMYNASATLPRLLHSLYGQSYSKWMLYLIDDLSSPNEREEEARVITRFRSLRDQGCRHLKVKWNSEKKWEVANVIYGINEACCDEDIVCRIDADDWLVDLDALHIINEAYNDTKCNALWTAHRWGYSDKNISGPLPDDADPYVHPWVTSHLKTFKKRLLNDVCDENFRGEDGEYIQRAGDQAIYLPVLRNAGKRVFLPRVMYHYTIEDVPETYQTDDARFQRDEAQFLRRRGYVI